MSIETSSQSNRAADRLKQFDAKVQEDKYWGELIGDAGETDFSDEARLRLEEAAAYDAHLEKISKNESYGTLDSALDNAEAGEYKDSIDRLIDSNPQLRRLAARAEAFNKLRNEPQFHSLADAEKRSDVQEQDILDTLLEIEEQGGVKSYTRSTTEEGGKINVETVTLDKNDISEINNRIFDRMYREASPATTTTETKIGEKSAKEESKPVDAVAETDDIDALADIKAADVSLDSGDKAGFLDMDEINRLAALEAADVSLGGVTTVEATTGITPEDISVLENMEPADVSLASNAEPQNDLLSEEDAASLNGIEAANVSLEQEEEHVYEAEPFLDVEGIQSRLSHEEETTENHRRNRFNPMYRAHMLFNKATSKIRERTGNSTANEKSRAAKIGLGIVGIAAVSLAAVAAYKSNPDIQNWLNDIGNNLGFDNIPDTSNTPAPIETGNNINPDNGSIDTTPPVTPETPAVPELLNTPAFNTLNGGGGEALMSNLGIDTQKWYTISADLPDLFPNDFYREQLPSGFTDIRFRHTGFLSEDAQKVLLQRLGK
jgi:hypothetical protein